MTSPRQLSKVLPLGRLYTIHRDINSYQQKWTKNKLFNTVFAPGNELTFTTIQNVNRILSPIGPILIATNYPLEGGIITTIFLYIEFTTSYCKEKIFKADEIKQEWEELNKNTENLGNGYQELAQIMKPIRSDNSLNSWHRLINSLKEETQKLAKKDNKDGLKEAELLKIWNNDNLSTRRVGRWFKNLPMILTGRPLSDVSLKSDWWSKEWGKRSTEREKIKDLLEVLQEAISEYRQDVPNDEIEKKIERGIKRAIKTEIKSLDSILENTLEIRKNMVQEREEDESSTETEKETIAENNEKNRNETNQEVAISIENHIEVRS